MALDACRNRLDAAAAHVAGAFDAQAMWAGDGARSSAGWIAADAEAARAGAVRDVKLGRALTSMPETDAALSNGSLGAAKARLLADAAKHAPDAFVRDESLLVANAQSLRVDAAKSMLEFWKARANPDDADDAEQRRFEARAVFLSQTLDGMWRLDGMLPAELGEVLAGELDRRSRALYESDKALADANGTPLARTAAQRRVDALVELALHASVNEDGATINRPAVTAVIHVDQVTDPATQPGDPVGRSEHGQPVTKTTAQRLLCDCAMSRVVLDANSARVDPLHDRRRAGRRRHQGRWGRPAVVLPRGPGARQDNGHRLHSDRGIQRRTPPETANARHDPLSHLPPSPGARRRLRVRTTTRRRPSHSDDPTTPHSPSPNNASTV